MKTKNKKKEAKLSSYFNRLMNEKQKNAEKMERPEDESTSVKSRFEEVMQRKKEYTEAKRQIVRDQNA